MSDYAQPFEVDGIRYVPPRGHTHLNQPMISIKDDTAAHEWSFTESRQDHTDVESGRWLRD